MNGAYHPDTIGFL